MPLVTFKYTPTASSLSSCLGEETRSSTLGEDTPSVAFGEASSLFGVLGIDTGCCSVLDDASPSREALYLAKISWRLRRLSSKRRWVSSSSSTELNCSCTLRLNSSSSLVPLALCCLYCIPCNLPLSFLRWLLIARFFV